MIGRISFAFGSFLFANAIMAGQIVGNGGDAVVCRDESGKITRAELYDYYEGRELRGLHISLPNETDPVKLAVKTIERLKDFDKARSERIAARINQFKDDTQFINTGLVDIPDMGMVIIDPACKIEQLVIYREPDFQYDKRITISNEIWSHLTLQDKAGTILHELIYEDARLFAQVDSQSSRYLNALVSSSEFSSWTQEQYLDFLRKAVLKEGMYLATSKKNTKVVLESFLIKLNMYNALKYCEDHAIPNHVGHLAMTADNQPWEHSLPVYSFPKAAPFLANLKLSASWWVDDAEANDNGYTNSLIFDGVKYIEHNTRDTAATLMPFICRYDLIQE